MNSVPAGARCSLGAAHHYQTHHQTMMNRVPHLAALSLLSIETYQPQLAIAFA
ncbi:MAG: hypothetical protein ACREPR_10715 [Brasilonema sp.]